MEQKVKKKSEEGPTKPTKIKIGKKNEIDTRINWFPYFCKRRSNVPFLCAALSISI